MHTNIKNLNTYAKFIAPKGHEFIQPSNRSNNFEYLSECNEVKSLTQNISQKYGHLPFELITSGIFEAYNHHGYEYAYGSRSSCEHSGANTKNKSLCKEKAEETLKKLTEFQQKPESEQLEMIEQLIKAQQDKKKQESKAKRDALLVKKAKLEEELAKLEL
jgi:hypothetical protein